MSRIELQADESSIGEVEFEIDTVRDSEEGFHTKVEPITPLREAGRFASDGRK